MLTSKAPFAIITNRANRLLNRIETRIQTGQISNRVPFLIEILEGIARFTRASREPALQTHG